MIVAPFHDHDVFAPFAYQVTNVVVISTCVLHEYLLAWSFGSMDAHEENIVTYNYDFLSDNKNPIKLINSPCYKYIESISLDDREDMDVSLF